MNTSTIESLKKLLFFLENLHKNDPSEYAKIEFLDTTKEYVQIYLDRAEDFQITNSNNLKSKNAKAITLKTIKDLGRNGIVIASTGEQIIGYARFSEDQRLMHYLKGKDFNPIEFSEIYVVPDLQNERIGMLLFKEVEKAARTYRGVDSGILSLSKVRAEKHNLVEKYTNMGCDECYKHIINPQIKHSDKVIDRQENVPEKYDLLDYIMIDNLNK